MKRTVRTVFICAAIAVSEMRGEITKVVNGASFAAETGIGPGSIISVFGTNLTNTTASAADATRIPATLGGVTLTVGGESAGLFYVSPTQINALLSARTRTGSVPLVLTSPTGTFTKNITVSRTAAPGIFTFPGSGARGGAILNAVTFAPGPFVVSENEKPTYLAIFVTGLDPSGTPPVVTAGGMPLKVTFFGPAPCCPGLQQINAELNDALDGAGRVELVVEQGSRSNAVELMILPKMGSGPHPPKDKDGKKDRDRELATLTYIPNTSLVLLSDERDDKLHVLDVVQRKIVRTIDLPKKAEPFDIAVNTAGTLAVVAERELGKVAIIDLATWAVVGEVATGGAPASVAISGNTAVIANQDGDSASFVDITTRTLLGSVAVGRSPRAVAVDSAGNAYVVNQGDGTISVINVGTRTVTKTLTLGTGVRPQAIEILPDAPFAVLTEPSRGRDGRVLFVNLNTGTITPFDVNLDHSGGAGDIAVSGGKLYLAIQTGGQILAVPYTISGGNVTLGTAVPVRVDLGARSLAIDTKDKLLLVGNQGTGTIVLVDLTTNQVVGRIDGVRGDDDEDDDDDEDEDGDDDDRDNRNAPSITSIAPATGKAGTTVGLTITGTNLTGAREIEFLEPRGNGNGNGASPDRRFTVSNIQVNAAGTQLTASVAIASGAAAGNRTVVVSGPNGRSSRNAASATTFRVE